MCFCYWSMTHPILTSLMSTRTGEGLRPLPQVFYSWGLLQTSFSTVSVGLSSSVECRLIKHSVEAVCKLRQKPSLLAELNKKPHSEASEPVHFRSLSHASFHKGSIVFISTQQGEGGKLVSGKCRFPSLSENSGVPAISEPPLASVQTSQRQSSNLQPHQW